MRWARPPWQPSRVSGSSAGVARAPLGGFVRGGLVVGRYDRLPGATVAERDHGTAAPDPPPRGIGRAGALGAVRGGVVVLVDGAPMIAMPAPHELTTGGPAEWFRGGAP